MTREQQEKAAAAPKAVAKILATRLGGQPEDYRKAVQRIYHAPGQASSVELPVVTMP